MNTRSDLAAGIAACLLAACAQTPRPDAASARPAPVTAAPVAANTPAIAIEPAAPAPPAHQEIVEAGTDVYVAPRGAERVPNTPAGAADVDLRFQATDLREVAKVVLGDMLGLNYLIDPSVSGTVTLETSHPITRDDILPLFEEILALHNAALVRRGELYQIVSRAGAMRSGVRPSTRGTVAGFQIRVLPLRHIAATEIQKILEPLLATPTDLRVDAKRNLLIAAGMADELDVIVDTVAIFDVDWLRGMSIGLYPLEHVAPATLQGELEAILRAVDPDGGANPLGGLVRVVGLERLRSVLLIGTTNAALREAESWLRRLDRPGDAVDRQLFVYRLQNAKASDIAEILEQVFGAGGGTTARAPSALPPPTIPPPNATASKGAEPISSTPTRARERAASNGAIEFIADEARNALLVLATANEYRMVESALRELDVAPLQVLIEASIVEVNLRDELNYGIEWFFKDHLGTSDRLSGRGTLDLGAVGLAPLGPSFSYTVVDSAEQVRAVLNALASTSRINVLSSPSLMVLNNQRAMINVGDEIPIPTRQSTSNLNPDAPTVNEIQFRKTGITLNVTPRVNSGGLVTLEIKQEVATATATTTSSLNAPTIQNRAIESVVAIDSGETIVLGGLIRNTAANGNAGLPLLHRIPVLGKLFGHTSRDEARTELLVLITPRVIASKRDAREATEEMRKKMRGLQGGL